MISGIVALVLGGLGLCVIIYFKFQDEPTKEARIFRVVDEYDNGRIKKTSNKITPEKRSPVVINQSFYWFPDIIPHEYIVFDLETTGLDYSNDYIAQIGALKIVNDEIIDSMSCYIKIPIKMPVAAFKVNGITNNMLDKEGISEYDAVKALKEFAKNMPMFAYNARFDGSFYAAACQRSGLGFNNDIFCILFLARDEWRELSSHKLAVLAKVFGIAMHQNHDALDDSRLAFEVMKLGIAGRRAERLRLIQESGQIPFNKEFGGIEFSSKLFTFLGCNDKTAKLAEKLGAQIKANTTLKTHALVIGSGVDAAWKYTNHKNNIEKAILYRDDRKKPLLIISERMFIHAAMQHIK